jgi:hypothetical protein
MKLGVLLAVAWMSLPLPAAATSSERFAIIIGNNIGAPDEPALRYAETDALRIYDVLRELGGYEPTNMALLRGADAETVRSSLIAWNDRIRERSSAPNTEVVLFVYYSGHADPERLHLGGTALRMTELAQLVRGSAAQFRLVVLDACHSGAVTRTKGARVKPAFALPSEHGAGEGVAFLTATTADEDAQESDALGGSFFTHAFVSALLGAADRNHDGRVVLDEAYQYAYEATLRATSRTLAGTQHASFRYDYSGRGDIVLTAPAAHGEERATLHFPATGEFLLLRDSESGTVVADLGGHADNRQLSVAPGRYFVRARLPEVLYEGTIDARAGSSHEIDLGGFTRIAYSRLVRKGLSPSTAVHGLETGFRFRTPLPNERDPCLGGFLGYSLDLEEFGLGGRFSACTSRWSRNSLFATTDSYDFAGRIYRAWDWSRFSVEVGVELGAAVFLQRFDTVGRAASRLTFAPMVGPRLLIGFDFGGGFFGALDVGGETYFLRTQAPREDPTTEPHFALRTSLALGKRL